MKIRSLVPSRRRALLASSLAPLLLLVACGSADDPPVFAEGDDLAHRLEADTGVKWTVHRAAGGAGEIVLFGPAAPVAIAGSSREEATRAFFAEFGPLVPAVGPAEGLGALVDERDADGAGVVRIARVIPGTTRPVFDSAIAIVFDAAGKVVFVDPGSRASFDGIATSPRIDEATARRAALEGRSGCTTPNEPVPVVLGATVRDGRATLAYRVALEASEGCEASIVDVDATTGAISAERSASPSLLDRGYGARHYLTGDPADVKPLQVSQAPDSSFTLVDGSGGPRVSTSRTDESGRTALVSTRTLGSWGDVDRGVTVDAHYHVARALDYFRVVHGRAGLDGRNGPVTVITNDRTGANANGINAFYSDFERSIRFSGAFFQENRQFHPLAISFDLVVHELAHGVLANTSKLVYWGESGAINESFADVMGTAAEQWLPEKRGAGDFLIARESTVDGLGLRDMANPASRPEYRQSEDYERRACHPGVLPHQVEDNCWVHGDSGIGNRAFALMTVGGATPRAGVARGIGFEASRYVWWQSVVHAGDPRLDWRKLAIAQGYVARAIGFETFASVTCAWIGVGVISRAEGDPQGNLCAPPSTAPRGSTCAGVEDGYVCMDSSPASAYRCVRGAIAGGVPCADFTKTCSHSAFDWRASLGPDGRLVCH